MSRRNNSLEDLSTAINSVSSRQEGANQDRYSRLSACHCCVTTRNPEYVCRWKYFLRWVCIIGPILTGIFLAVVFLAYIPYAAQSAMDNSELVQLYLAMSNATSNSININATIQIVNAGPYDATLLSTKATLTYNGHSIGTLKQPKININANTGATFSLVQTIEMHTHQERHQFAKMASHIFAGKDSTIMFNAKPTLEVKMLGIYIASVDVNMNKKLVIPGTRLESPNIKNMSIYNMSMKVFAMTEIEFASSSPLHVYGGAVVFNIYDKYNNQIGIAKIPEMSVVPGYNRLTDIVTILFVCNCSNTSQSNYVPMVTFTLNYEAGINQILNMKGPLPGENGLVIANAVDTDAFLYGYCEGPTTTTPPMMFDM